MISLVAEYFLAIALFFSFITLIFYGFPVAWTMGGLGVLFIFISSKYFFKEIFNSAFAKLIGDNIAMIINISFFNLILINI